MYFDDQDNARIRATDSRLAGQDTLHNTDNKGENARAEIQKDAEMNDKSKDEEEGNIQKDEAAISVIATTPIAPNFVWLRCFLRVFMLIIETQIHFY